VALSQPAADQFFAAIRNDKQVTGQPKTSAASKIAPSQVRVQIFNATGTQGLAGRISDQLQAQGFQVIKVGTLPRRKTTQVLYGSGGDQQAATLAAVIPGTRPVPRTNGTTGVVDLIVGSDFTSVKAKKTAIPKLQGEIHANDDLCKTP
jgi:hypothetical protein